MRHLNPLWRFNLDHPQRVQETLHQLQHFEAVQMFSHLSDLGPDQRVTGSNASFMWSYWNDRERTWLGSPRRAQTHHESNFTSSPRSAK